MSEGWAKDHFSKNGCFAKNERHIWGVANKKATEVYVISLMLPVEISNTHVPELSMQLVPFVTMK
jgi:hypothetical protein